MLKLKKIELIGQEFMVLLHKKNFFLSVCKSSMWLIFVHPVTKRRTAF